MGLYVQLFYGSVILSFMPGILWGFATKTDGTRAATGYAMSAIPALWVFFFMTGMTGGGPVSAGMNLIFGFVGLLLLDYAFFQWGLASPWWMHLRLLLTAIDITCLAIGVVY